MTPEQIEVERSQCAYFYVTRSERAYEWEKGVLEHTKEFREHCTKSKSVFLRQQHWMAILNSPELAMLLDPSFNVDSLAQGKLGVLLGAEIYCDCHAHPHARDSEEIQHIVFDPRT